jgi:exonuclease III
MLNAHDVPCAICGAKAGENCRYEDGSDVGKDISHRRRLYDLLCGQETKQQHDEAKEEDVELGGWVRGSATP